MTEKLLQYIWQFQYFNTTEIESADGEPIVILHPGNLNTNQGPDFNNAKIKVGDAIWAGHVELHIQSSDWLQHKHSMDKNYGNVVLHVVWKNDTAIKLPFPTLELQDKVPKLLLKKYEEMMAVARFIPCENNIKQVPSIVWEAWKERMLIERLQQKSALVKAYLKDNNNHWEETFWWLLAKNFGVKINSDSFEKIARSLPLTILAKHKNQVQQLEALLFGQASLLTGDFIDSYMVMLQKEYQFLQKKYQLLSANAPLYFLRMRPSNFPTVRLAQLAMLVHNSVHLFSVIKHSTDIQEVKKLLDVTANDYWHYHYMPDEESAFKEKRLGAQMADNILINTVIPILFTYGYLHGDSIVKDRALLWMDQISAEKNNITKGFEAIGIANKSAFDSQALIQLKNEYCNNKRCLECAIGNKLLREK
jgi:hypothetical protein